MDLYHGLYHFQGARISVCEQSGCWGYERLGRRFRGLLRFLESMMALRTPRARRRFGATFIMFLLAGATVDAGPQPAGVPGVMKLIPAARHPILFFGEYHGSVQSPAFFGDAVAEMSAFRPVLVILEQNQSEAHLVSRYVSGKISMRDVVDSGEWLWASKAPLQREDGRHSIAMVKLIYEFRHLREQGRDIEIGGTNADKLPPHITYNAEMASNILRLSNALAFPGVTMVYTGTAHAQKVPGRAGGLLPSRRTISITTVPEGKTLIDSLWICREKKANGIFCGNLIYQHMPQKDSLQPCGEFGIHRSSSARIKETGFDAYGCVDAPITSSPPATPENYPAWSKYN